MGKYYLRSNGSGKNLMELADKAEYLVDMVGLNGFEDKYPHQLSERYATAG